MFKNVATKSLFIASAIAVLALNTGCFNSVTGPAQEQEVPGLSIEVAKAGWVGWHPCDLNRDGKVSISDVQFCLMASTGDVNNDESVDGADLALIERFLGQSYPEDLSGLTASELALAVAVRSVDLDNDYQVTASDVARFLMLQTMAERSDVNADGYVNQTDVSEIEAHFGQGGRDRGRRGRGDEITPSV